MHRSEEYAVVVSGGVDSTLVATYIRDLITKWDGIKPNAELPYSSSTSQEMKLSGLSQYAKVGLEA